MSGPDGQPDAGPHPQAPPGHPYAAPPPAGYPYPVPYPGQVPGSPPYGSGYYYGPGPYAPMYQQYQRPVAPPQEGNGLAVAALVLGITSILFCWLGLLTLVQVVLALTFGGMGISRANRGASGKGLAIAGLVLGCVGLVVYFFVGLVSFGIGWFV